jgi:hypothetical protein
MGVSSKQLETSSFQASHHNQKRNNVVVRLLAEGSVVVLVMALGWWGMWSLGSYTLASHSDSLTAERDPIYVAGCPVPDPLEKSSAQEGVGEGRGCTEEGSSHPTTLRRPGGGLDGHAHGADRFFARSAFAQSSTRCRMRASAMASSSRPRHASS